MTIRMIVDKDELNFNGSFSLTKKTLTLHQVTALESKLFLLEHCFRRAELEHSYSINLKEVKNLHINPVSLNPIDEANLAAQAIHA